MTTTEHDSDFQLMGELCGVYYENFEENWPRYNGTALYMDILLAQWHLSQLRPSDWHPLDIDSTRTCGFDVQSMSAEGLDYVEGHALPKPYNNSKTP